MPQVNGEHSRIKGVRSLLELQHRVLLILQTDRDNRHGEFG